MHRHPTRLAVLLCIAGVLVGCSAEVWEAKPIDRVEPDGDRIVVGGPCHPEARATAEETGDRVEVTMEVKGDYLGDCYGTAVVQLDRPLGDRTVVDKTTGENVPVAEWHDEPEEGGQ